MEGKRRGCGDIGGRVERMNGKGMEGRAERLGGRRS